MALRWLGASGACEGKFLNESVCKAGTELYTTVDDQIGGTATIYEVFEPLIRRLMRPFTRNPYVDECAINTPDTYGYGVLCSSLKFTLPGPSADNPKGIRTFRFSYSGGRGRRSVDAPRKVSHNAP
jgi:hypothetical protein